MDHTSAGKTVLLLQTKELGPRHITVSASPRQLASPDPSRSLPEFLKAVEVASDPVIPVVASQLLHELLVLFLDRERVDFFDTIPPALLGALESAVRRLPFDHPYASLRSSPVVGKSQKVECPRFGWVPFLGFGAGVLGRLKPHQARLFRVDRQAVLAHSLGQDLHDSPGVVFSGHPDHKSSGPGNFTPRPSRIRTGGSRLIRLL